jgi:hypothetical protein
MALKSCRPPGLTCRGRRLMNLCESGSSVLSRDPEPEHFSGSRVGNLPLLARSLRSDSGSRRLWIPTRTGGSRLRCVWIDGPYTRRQDYSQGAIEICAKGPHTSLLQAPPRVRFTLGKSSIRSRYAESRPLRRASPPAAAAAARAPAATAAARTTSSCQRQLWTPTG